MHPTIDFVPLTPAIGFARNKNGRKGAAVAGMNVLRNANVDGMMMAQAAVQGYRAAVRDMEAAGRVEGVRVGKGKESGGGACGEGKGDGGGEEKVERKGRFTRFVDAKREHEEAERVFMEALEEHLGDDQKEGGRTREGGLSGSGVSRSALTRASSATSSAAQMKTRSAASSHHGSSKSGGSHQSKSNRGSSTKSSTSISHANNREDHKSKHGSAKSSSSRTRSSSTSSSLGSPNIQPRHDSRPHGHHHHRRHSTSHSTSTNSPSEHHHRINELEHALLQQREREALLHQQAQQQQHLRSPIIMTPDGRVVQSPHSAAAVAPPPYPNSPFLHAQAQQHERENMTQRGERGGYYYYYTQSNPQGYDQSRDQYEQVRGRPGWDSRLGRGETAQRRGASARRFAGHGRIGGGGDDGAWR